MASRKRTKNRAKFSLRKQSLRGCIGFCVVILVIIGLLVSIYFSFKKGGNAGLGIGSVGVISIVGSIIGLVLEITSLKEEDIYKMIPITGTVLGTLAFLAWGGILAIGVFF